MSNDTLAVVVSRADEASVHVGERLRTIADWEATTDDSLPDGEGGDVVYRRPGVELRTFDDRHLDLSDVAAAFDDPRLLAFASRHSGETGPLLTAHHTGNFGPAEYGGVEGELARAAPNALAHVLDSFEEYAPEGYDVGMECTHHGPTEVGAPSLFVELGSGPEEWSDPDGADAVARAILDLAGVRPDLPDENGHRRHLVGFGGGHYVPRFERVVRETDWAVGHVAADWCLGELGDPGSATDVLDAAFAESAATYALLDGDRPELAEVVESLGHRVVGETWVRETTAVPLALVERLEDAVGSVDDGLRFGAAARGRAETAPGFVVGSVPDDLVDALNAVDREATLAAVDEVVLAYGTENAGSRFAGPVALVESADEGRLLDAFESVLSAGYDDVTVGEDEIRVRRREFDPELAREAGVEPGPAFGRLADGETVVVDGNHITPEDVTVDRKEWFSSVVTPD